MDGDAFIQSLPHTAQPVATHRLEQQKDIATTALSKKQDSRKSNYVDGLTENIIGIRAHGIFDIMAKKWCSMGTNWIPANWRMKVRRPLIIFMDQTRLS